MTFDDLITAHLINPQEAKIYRLFNMSDEGREWFNAMLMDTFMDCMPPPAMTNAIAFYTDGRRSIIRDIKLTIDKIHRLLSEEAHG